MRNYRDLQVWSKAHNLTLELYRVSRGFPREEIYGITSQLRRAAASIGANLAEGCGRPRQHRTGQVCENRPGFCK
jgi:four helix bundle protein